jgi:hypothetical protein
MPTATDRLDILELVARADNAATLRDADAYVSCFTDHAVLDGEKGEYRGKDRLRESVGPIWASEGPVSAHVTLNAVVDDVEGYPNRAIVSSLLLILRNKSRANITSLTFITQHLVDQPPVSIASISFITQHLIKVDSRWLIERRSVQAVVA